MTVQERSYCGQPGDFMTVRHLTIHGSNMEIGRTLGELAIKRDGRTPTHFEADPLYVRARRAFVQRHYPIQWQRIRGVAAAFDLDPEDDRFDLTGLPHLVEIPPQAFACSAVYYPPDTTATGGGYLSRNYDFFVGSMAEVMQLPLPPTVTQQLPPAMSEPYVMQWHPEDGGYASLAIHAFDTLAGTLDGLNSAGLVVSILADNEALNELGPRLEPHLGPQQVVGLHELAVMRLLLDTCATAAEAKQALLSIKQYYRFVPCHYIVADRAGHSFVYENTTGRNVQHVINGNGQPQVVTNFQLHRHASPQTIPGAEVTLANEAFWRYRVLTQLTAKRQGGFTVPEIRAACDGVNVLKVVNEAAADDPLRAVPTRTVWHNLYDQQAGAMEVSFYLGESVLPDGTRRERRSDYLRFTLDQG